MLNRLRMRSTLKILYFLLPCFILICQSCGMKEKYYTAEDFAKVPKTDAHFHYLTADDSYMKFAESLNFRLVTPIWEGDVPIDTQLAVSMIIKKSHPGTYSFFTSFHTGKIMNDDFPDSAIAYEYFSGNER